MRFTAPRVILLSFVAALLVAAIISTGAHRPTIEATAAMRQLQPRMRGFDLARATCTPSNVGRPCTAQDIADSPTGRAMDMRADSACIQPSSACVHLSGDTLIAELVSRELPQIGGIRLEGRAQRGDTTLAWTCRPARAGADAGLVRRACGEVRMR